MTGALFALRRGEGAGCLVLLHGFGASHRSWLPVIGALPQHVPLLAFDLPGHAASLPVEGLAAREMAKRVVDSLPATMPYHLAGHSMGGTVAALIAMDYPERVASLTLLAPGGFGPHINHRLLKRYAAARTGPELIQVLESMFGWNSPVPEDLVDDLQAMRALDGQTATLERIAARLARNGVQGMLDRDRLAELPMPVKVVWGSLDPVLPIGQADGLPYGFAVHRLADAGHMLPLERADEIAWLLRQQMR